MLDFKYKYLKGPERHIEVIKTWLDFRVIIPQTLGLRHLVSVIRTWPWCVHD